ncbi:hypothetical protein Y981_08900 [Leptospirillum ferriphilum YSK]|uniref:Uncharacterized protein n=1 Tax=Leptospirillum ferriphilum YSK TaxID=1441628 RepID=A0A059XY86_9BACT|nr:hypothetical protein Y981_08900 [Leptospirillum ferriphilum YSK]
MRQPGQSDKLLVLKQLTCRTAECAEGRKTGSKKNLLNRKEQSCRNKNKKRGCSRGRRDNRKGTPQADVHLKAEITGTTPIRSLPSKHSGNPVRTLLTSFAKESHPEKRRT